MDEDLQVTAVEYFDATVLTVTDGEGTEYRILLHNPAPAAVELTDADVTVKSHDKTETDALVEAYGLRIESGEEDGEDKAVGYAAFDISLADADASAEGGYIVPVTLDTPVELPTKEGMQNKVAYELFHITDNGAEKVEILSVSDNNGAGPITAFTFRTDSFSDYVMRYTVDFEYADEQGEVRTFSLNGYDEWLLEEILTRLGIEYETIESATLELTEIVDERDIDENGNDALYLDGDAETCYILHSYAPFNDVYTLTVMADGEEYVIDKIADSIDHYVECFNLKGLTTRLQDVA